MNKGLRRMSVLAVAIMMVFAMTVVTSAATAVETTTTYSNGKVTVTSAVSGLSDFGGVVTYIAHNAAADITDEDIVYFDENTVAEGATTTTFVYVADTTADDGKNNALAGTTTISVGGPLVNDGVVYSTTLGGEYTVSGVVAGYSIEAVPAVFNAGDTVTITVTKPATVISSVDFTNNGAAAQGTIVADKFSVIAEGDIVITAVNDYVAPTATITNIKALQGDDFGTSVARATGEYIARGVIFSQSDISGELDAAAFDTLPTLVEDLDFEKLYKLQHIEVADSTNENFAISVRGLKEGTYYMRPYIEMDGGEFAFANVCTFTF